MKRVLEGLLLFSLGGATGYLVCRKILRKQYDLDLEDIQSFYIQKIEELGVMPAGYDPDEDDSEAEELTEEEQADIAAWVKAAKATESDSRGVLQRPKIDYTKPSLGQLRRMYEADEQGSSVLLQANGEELLGDIDDEEYEPSIDEEYLAELEQTAEEYAIQQSLNKKKRRPIFDRTRRVSGRSNRL